MRKILYLGAFFALGAIMLVATAPQAYAAPLSQGPLNGGTFADNSATGTVTWTNPSYAQFSDDSYATTSGAAVFASHYLQVTNFGFSIPVGATISGIEVRVERKTDSTSVQDRGIFMVKNGSIIGTNHASSTTWVQPTEIVATYGGPSDLWGTSWSPSDINNSLSGVVFAASRTVGAGQRTIYVDNINVTVYYTLPTTVTLSYSAGANGSLTGSTTQVVAFGGDGAAVTAVPDMDYHFVDWSDAATSNPRTDLSVAGDITVTANFAAGSGSGGSHSPFQYAPENTSVVINSNAASTNNTAVTLTLSATNAVDMMLSNDANFSDGVWEQYATSKNWVLTTGLGIKTVWAKFKNINNTSAGVYDEIELLASPAPTVETATSTPAQETPAETVVPNLPAGCPTLAAGDMVKVTGKPAIYALNSALEAMYFPSGDVFKSWRPTYGGYLSISQTCFDALKVPNSYPAAINYRPGSYLVSRPSSDQVYTVLPGNTLAKISSSIANSLYGTSAYTGGVGSKVTTVSDIFWPHYVNRGADITTVSVHPGMVVKSSGKTYYVDSSNKLREVTTAGFSANGFQQKFVRAVSASAIAGFEIGVNIDSAVSSIVDKTQGAGAL